MEFARFCSGVTKGTMTRFPSPERGRWEVENRKHLRAKGCEAQEGCRATLSPQDHTSLEELVGMLQKSIFAEETKPQPICPLTYKTYPSSLQMHAQKYSGQEHPFLDDFSVHFCLSFVSIWNTFTPFTTFALAT